MVKVFAHTSYIGTTGYNNHARDFFRHLSKLVDIKIRNYTIGDKWLGSGITQPHDKEPYIDELDKKLLCYQSLWKKIGYDLVDSAIYPNYPNDFDHEESAPLQWWERDLTVNIILAESNHHYFYDSYRGLKIGYNVWESTEQETDFFKCWKAFDQLWVPSKWQAECTIKQGADPNKVKVVPEGVDVNVFYPEDVKLPKFDDDRFKFIHFGRWDYRKSTKEIIETFINTFDKDEPVDLILSIDNKFCYDLDKCNSTEERLEKFKINDPRLKLLSFVSREDYIKYMKAGNVFLSCARSEGWNLPLIEAMACGTPSIHSNCSGQLEFAKGKGLPVKIIEEQPAQSNTYGNWGKVNKDGKIPGNYYEPDYNDLSNVMRDAYENYSKHKKKALEDAKIIKENFNWDRVAEIGKATIDEFLKSYNPPRVKDNEIIINYNNGPKVEIIGDQDKEYNIEFVDTDTDKIIHKETISNNMWVRCSREYYTNWSIRINNKIYDIFNVKNKKVLIYLDSKSIGDTIAWAPYAVEFQKKHNCKVTLSTWHNDWFKKLKPYKNIKFANQESSSKYYASYSIGWFKDGDKWEKGNKNPTRANLIPLQQTATDILGLEFKEINYGINLGKGKRPIKKKYVVFSPQATAGCKEWVFDYWRQLADSLILKGYKVVVCSKIKYNIPGTININKDLKVAATYLKYADLFIGLGSGLSWLNWALGKKTIMINGFSKPGHEFTSNLIRVTKNICIKCWNDPVHTFDAGDWDWCPVYKGSKLQHICQKSILPSDVLKFIK